MTQEKQRYNYVASGIHDFQAFTKVRNDIYDKYTSDGIFEDLYFDNIDLEIKRLIEEQEYTEEEAEEAAREYFYDKLACTTYMYLVNIYKNEMIAQQLDLLMFTVQSDQTYILDCTGTGGCALEAYQALVDKSVDVDAALIQDAKYFIEKMGQQIYNECIQKIAKFE